MADSLSKSRRITSYYESNHPWWVGFDHASYTASHFCGIKLIIKLHQRLRESRTLGRHDHADVGFTKPLTAENTTCVKRYFKSVMLVQKYGPDSNAQLNDSPILSTPNNSSDLVERRTHRPPFIHPVHHRFKRYPEIDVNIISLSKRVLSYLTVKAVVATDDMIRTRMRLLLICSSLLRLNMKL